MAHNSTGSSSDVVVYGGTARAFHWLTVVLVVVQISIGLYMTYRGYDLVWTNEAGEQKTGLFDATTAFLYDSHKVLGVTILLVVVLRLLNRLIVGAPPPEPTITMWQKIISTVVHWLLYLSLIVVPVLGYLGASYFGALRVFESVTFPAVVGVDKDVSKIVFEYHELAAFTLIGLIVAHVAAALFHAFIRRDNVLARMIPSMLKSDRA